MTISDSIDDRRPTALDGLSTSLLNSVRTSLGDLWEEKLSIAEQELIRGCCADAAELQIRALAALPTREAQLALLREKAQIHAQLMNCASLGAQRVADAFWGAVRGAVNGAVAIAFAAV